MLTTLQGSTTVEPITAVWGKGWLAKVCSCVGTVRQQILENVARERKNRIKEALAFRAGQLTLLRANRILDLHLGEETLNLYLGEETLDLHFSKEILDLHLREEALDLHLREETLDLHLRKETFDLYLDGDRLDLHLDDKLVSHFSDRRFVLLLGGEI